MTWLSKSQRPCFLGSHGPAFEYIWLAVVGMTGWATIFLEDNLNLTDERWFVVVFRSNTALFAVLQAVCKIMSNDSPRIFLTVAPVRIVLRSYDLCS
ncbi:MAG: hypothetical protein AB7T49_04215 [Oligoflexales bacterium]